MIGEWMDWEIGFVTTLQSFNEILLSGRNYNSGFMYVYLGSINSQHIFSVNYNCRTKI